MKIKKIERVGKADVYNMEVEGTHSFVIQGGIVSHNCSDEWRYMCMARPVKPIIPEKPREIISDPLNQFKKDGYKANGYH